MHTSTSDLSFFFRPNGVAVIGASAEPQKLGHGVVRNLQSVRYEGPIYPVNPREEYILGYKVYPSIGEVPDPVELAVVVVPASMVAGEVEACGKRGVKGAIIISGGFRETGPEGEARERRVQQIAAQYGIRLLGPNCIGTIDAHTPLNTTFVVGMPRPGDIAFLSQSGAMAAAVMDWAAGSGVGFSRIVSLGNQVDVNSAEMLAHIGSDGRTRVVTGYMEGVTDGRAFLRAAASVARQMPVLFLKGGRGTSGAKATASHTGALAGDLAAYKAGFRRAGVLWANTMEELFDWGRALAWQPLPRGNSVAILTNAGGPAILAADALEEAGMRLAPLTPDTKAFLRRRVLAAASVENPVDILAGAGPATYALCLDALLTDETVDAVVVIQAPQDWFKPASLAEVVGEVANSPLGQQKPVLTVIMGVATASDATQILHSRRVPNYQFPERIGSTLAAMWQRKQWLRDSEALASEGAGIEPLTQRTEGALTPGGSLSGIREGLEAARAALQPTGERGAAGEGWLGPERVEALLRAYGIRMPDGGLAADAESAVEVAEKVGYPVALKLVAEDVTHKTDVGGVALNVKGPEELRAEFAAMLQRVRERAPEVRASGVYLQKMLKGAVELIIGVVRDSQFGPLVMAGTGGTGVEVRGDVAFELAPLTTREAHDLLDRTSAGKLLGGFRGAAPADRAAAVDVILRLSQIALDWPGIEEIEVNPLIVMGEGDGAAAVDARVRVG
jgi:acetyltransferase